MERRLTVLAFLPFAAVLEPLPLAVLGAQRLDSVLLDALADHPDADHLVIDLSRLGRIDTTGALVLRSVLDQARVAGLTAEARGTPPQSRKLTERVLGAERDPLG